MEKDTQRKFSTKLGMEKRATAARVAPPFPPPLKQLGKQKDTKVEDEDRDSFYDSNYEYD